jgi:hypothetical protein
MSEQIDKKQKLLLEYLITSPDIFSKCYKITDASYFEAPLDRVVEFSLEHFMKYGGLPTPDMIDAETGVMLRTQDIETKSDVDYFLEEYELFCRESAMANAILTSVDLINDGKSNEVEELVRQAMLVKLDTSVGTDLFYHVGERIIDMDISFVNYSTGSKQVDDLVGFIRRGELFVTAAMSSGGKSLHLGSMGIALARQQLDVAIVSLELNEALYSKRMDSMISKVDIAHHRDNAEKIDGIMADEKKNMAEIVIKQLSPGSNAGQIRAYLLEYSLKYKKYPDVLVVDYIGIMGANTKSSNKFDQDEEKAIALRQMAVDYDMIVLTAQQLNRDADGVVDISYSHLAGGISLANNSDTVIALVQTEEDIDNNQIQIRGIKLRNAPKRSRPVILYRCPKTLRFGDDPFIKGKAPSVSKPIPTKGVDKPAEKQTSTASSGTKSKLRDALKLKK